MNTPAIPEGLPNIGDIIAEKYQVQRIIGVGGMGIIVAACHLELDQLVAIKFLHPEFAHRDGAVPRFLREARAATRIQSEHAVRIRDVCKGENGVPYIVMEYLNGTDLDQILRTRGPLPIGETTDYILQACEAIAEAHARDIVHRDLKPSNLFLSRRADGSPLVKVLDFGISKLAYDPRSAFEKSLTTTNEILGTPLFMSPQQVRSFKDVDARTDIWALGVILHRLLSASYPFEADTLTACLAKIVADPPVPLRAKRPDAPAGMEKAILRCLEKDENRRYQNVAELAAALLPFAPEPCRVSVERITRVLMASDLVSASTLPLRTSMLSIDPTERAPDRNTPNAPEDTSSPPLASSQRSQNSINQPRSAPLPQHRIYAKYLAIGAGTAVTISILAVATNNIFTDHAQQNSQNVPTISTPLPGTADHDASDSSSAPSASASSTVGALESKTQTVEIVVHTQPAEAHVEIDGTPVHGSIMLPRSSRLLEIKARAPGYIDLVRPLRAERDAVVDLILRPSEPPAAAQSKVTSKPPAPSRTYTSQPAVPDRRRNKVNIPPATASVSQPAPPPPSAKTKPIGPIETEL